MTLLHQATLLQAMWKGCDIAHARDAHACFCAVHPEDYSGVKNSHMEFERAAYDINTQPLITWAHLSLLPPTNEFASLKNGLRS